MSVIHSHTRAVEFSLVRDVLSFFFQAEDGIRYLVRSRGLGDVYKRQGILRYSMIFGMRDCHSNSVFPSLAMTSLYQK